MSIGVLNYWNWLVGDIVCILSGSRTYPGPWPRLLTLNQVLPQGSQVTCITSQATCITCINKNGNMTECQSPHVNPTVEPSFGCATYILGTPKIQTTSPPSISQSRCKLFNYHAIILSRLFNAHGITSVMATVTTSKVWLWYQYNRIYDVSEQDKQDDVVTV